MGIGVSVFLLAVGGVLAFAVSDRVSGVDLTVVGYVLMGAGAIGLEQHRAHRLCQDLP